MSPLWEAAVLTAPDSVLRQQVLSLVLSCQKRLHGSHQAHVFSALQRTLFQVTLDLAEFEQVAGAESADAEQSTDSVDSQQCTDSESSVSTDWVDLEEAARGQLTGQAQLLVVQARHLRYLGRHMQRSVAAAAAAAIGC